MNIKLDHFFLLFCSVIILISGFLYFSNRKTLRIQSSYKRAKFITNTTTFNVEISDTPELRSLGLSSRKNLNADEGMLFIFPTAGFYSFWMKDMNFSLDFVWINGEKIIDLTENVPFPQSTEKLSTYTSRFPADKILEIQSGAIKKNNIKVGDLGKIEYL